MRDRSRTCSFVHNLHNPQMMKVRSTTPTATLKEHASFSSIEPPGCSISAHATKSRRPIPIESKIGLRRGLEYTMKNASYNAMKILSRSAHENERRGQDIRRQLPVATANRGTIRGPDPSL